MRTAAAILLSFGVAIGASGCRSDASGTTATADRQPSAVAVMSTLPPEPSCDGSPNTDAVVPASFD